MKIIPGEIKGVQLHQYLLGAISPRPICFASTIDGKGNPNLSPYSFFNVFGSNPVTLVFSPARRVRDNTIKHTLENIKETREVVINVVNYAMVEQMSLASTEYPKGVNEFVKAGFSMVKSEMVKPFRVKESPAQLECKVKDIIQTGENGGAGNLIICEMLCMHLNDEVLGLDGMIDPHKIDLVARMGKDYYCRASGPAVFEVEKPNLERGVGIDALPDWVRKSEILTGNELARLGNLARVPDKDEDFAVPDGNREEIIQLFLKEGNVHSAWQVIIA